MRSDVDASSATRDLHPAALASCPSELSGFPELLCTPPLSSRGILSFFCLTRPGLSPGKSPGAVEGRYRQRNPRT